MYRLLDDMVAFISKHKVYQVTVARTVTATLVALTAGWFSLITLYTNDLAYLRASRLIDVSKRLEYTLWDERH